MFSLEELFCAVDDFCQTFEPLWKRQLLSQKLQQRDRARQLCLSEIMTILIGFHQQRRAHVQGLLHQSRLGLLAYSFSGFGQLPTLCKLDAECSARVICLPQMVFWSLYGH